MSDSTEHISAADLTAGLPKSDLVTITTTRAQVERLRRLVRSCLYETVGDDLHDTMSDALRAVVGHERMLDMDNDPQHAYCAVCGYAMPEEEKR